MTLKVAVIQVAAAAGTPTYTQDFTDSNAGFSSDVKAAIFIGSRATANHTDTASAYVVLGLAGSLGGITSISASSQDAADPPTAGNYTRSRYSSDSYDKARVNDAGLHGSFTINSWLSNGVRVDWLSQATVLDLMNVVLLGGDIEAKVVTGAFTTAAPPDTQTIAHGLAGAPEFIIALSPRATTTPSGTNLARPSWGFWTAGAQVAMIQQILSHATSMSTHATVTSAASGGSHNAAASLAYKTTIGNVGATTFDVSTDTATSGNDIVSFLCVRGTSSALSVQAGNYTTPTSTGNNTPVTGMGAAAQLFLSIPSRLTAVDTSNLNDPAGAHGFIAAANNAGSGTQYGGLTFTIDDGAAPTNNSHEITGSQALRVLDVTGGALVTATVNSWNSDGVTLNYSAVDASNALKIPYLAIGVAGGGGGLVAPLAGKLGGLLTGKL